MEECFFCKIAGKQANARVVNEDGHTLAFLDIHPSAPGHTMVIPKVHAPTLAELPDGEVGPLFASVKRTAEIIAEKLRPDGITIGINQGRASGQEVDHLHVHLIPRWHGDGGVAVQSVAHNEPKESLDEILQKLTG